MNSLTLKSIWIENFQSHSQTKLEFADAGQLTVIVGPSDSGKTAILRALKWVLYNQPQGADFIRAGATQAVVALTYADGRMVVRERGRSYNRYRLVRPGQEDQVYEGFGSDVPLEIQEVTGVRPVEIGDLSLTLNLSEQLDGPFLGKSISAGARARVLGQLAGTEEVDHAARTLGADLHRASQEEKRLSGELETLAAQIREYDYLPTLAHRIERLAQLIGEVKAAEERRTRLERLVTRFSAIREQRAAAQAVLHRWRGLEEAQAALADAERASLRRDRLIGIGVRLGQVAAGQGQARLTLHRWARMDAAADLVRELDAMVERGRCLVGLVRRWQQIRDDVNTARARAEKWQGLEAAAELAGVVIDLGARAIRLTQIRGRLVHVREAQVVAENQAARYAGAVKDAQRQYVDTLAALNVCPFFMQVCPLHGSQVEKEAV